MPLEKGIVVLNVLIMMGTNFEDQLIVLVNGPAHVKCHSLLIKWELPMVGAGVFPVFPFETTTN